MTEVMMQTAFLVIAILAVRKLFGYTLHAKVGDGIQESAVMGDRNIRRIGDLDLILLRHSTVLHVHVVNFDAVGLVPSHCVGRNICHIFSLSHNETIPF